jgi:hypothetical protein
MRTFKTGSLVKDDVEGLSWVVRRKKTRHHRHLQVDRLYHLLQVRCLYPHHPVL